MARTILAMDQAGYAAAFKHSAIKRAKLWMLQRSAGAVLGNVGTADDLAVLEAMRSHEHDVVREHAAWAVRCIDVPDNSGSRISGTDVLNFGERALPCAHVARAAATGNDIIPQDLLSLGLASSGIDVRYDA